MSRFAKGSIARVFSLAVISLAFGPALQAQQPAAGYTHATRYNVSGQVTGTIAPDPDDDAELAFKATRNTYGTSGATRGLLVTVESGELSAWQNEYVEPAAWSGFAPYLTQSFAYDNHGRKIQESVIGSNGQVESVVQYSYDDWDRVKCKAVRMNKAAFGSLSSDACVLGAEGVSGPDRITQFTYNNFDQVLTEERAVGTTLAQTYVTNQYEFESRLLRFQTDAKGNKTELQYDEHQRLKKRLYPSPNSVGSVNSSDFNEYRYDNNGNVVFEGKRNTQTITNTFDNNNRLIFKDLSDNTYSADITYNYDVRGLMLSSCFSNGDDCAMGGEGESSTFDGFGNLKTSTSRQDGAVRILSYDYDREGNRIRITHPDGWFFAYGFDGLNRVKSLSESTSASAGAGTDALLTITYRPSGGRLDLIRPNGAVTKIDLDDALRLKSFTQNFAGDTNDLTNGFEYNPASQITKLTQSNPLYTYSEAGSRVGSYTPNGLNQIASIAGNALGYDGAGNLVSDAGTGMTYTYDMENRLVRTAGAATAALAYDTRGRLFRTIIAGNITYFSYDGDALVGEWEGGALTKRYVHGDQVDEPLVQYNFANVGPSYRRYLHADHQGSVIAQSDNAGNLLAHNKYDPYGVPGTANSGRFGYTGQTWIPQVGLNYYKARMYSPKLGRFLQTDPIFYADDMNTYAYVGNNPVNATDPSGTTTWFWGGAGNDDEAAYKSDMVAALDEAGVADANAVPEAATSPGGIAADLVLLPNVNNVTAASIVTPGVSPGGEAGDQYNLMGYSYGSALAAQQALTDAGNGIKVDNLVLVGAPINQDLMDAVQNSPNIANVIVENISGDPVYAGMSDGRLAAVAPVLAVQMMRGTGHFTYAGADPAAAARRRELVSELVKQGVR